MTNTYQPRTYRSNTVPGDLACFNVTVRETDLLICADSDLSGVAKDATLHVRCDIKNYIKDNPEFEKSLKPVEDDQKAPDIIKGMISASRACGVGPMAAVAGAIAETVGRQILSRSSQVIVENGGDIFISSKTKRLVGLYAGDNSKFKDKLVMQVEPESTPCGICTSSASVGHSLSFGKADAVVILSPSATLADACATALCNIVKTQSDIEQALSRARSIENITGILIAIQGCLGIWGTVKLIDI